MGLWFKTCFKTLLNGLKHFLKHAPVPVGSSKTCFKTLVFSGRDTHISNPRILNLVKRFHDSQYFDQIYYEAMDGGIEYIKPLPTGLLDFYVLGIPQGKFDSALKKINLGRLLFQIMDF